VHDLSCGAGLSRNQRFPDCSHEEKDVFNNPISACVPMSLIRRHQQRALEAGATQRKSGGGAGGAAGCRER
jgi:hypothetical protein